MLAESVKLLLRQIVAVIAPDMVQILGILAEEADEICILADRLPGKPEIILAEVEAVNVIMPASNVVIFARILLAQHQIIEDHQVFAAGI